MTDNYDPGTSLDWQANGVFFDNFTPKTPSGSMKGNVTTDLTFISNHDGTSKTLLASESLDALDWIALPPPGSSPTPGILNPLPDAPPQLPSSSGPTMPSPTYPLMNPAMYTASPTWWQGMMWDMNLAPLPKFLMNRTGLGGNPKPQPSFDILYALPSSNHPDVFLATMVDGSTHVLSTEMDFRVYALLMRPTTWCEVPGPEHNSRSAVSVLCCLAALVGERSGQLGSLAATSRHVHRSSAHPVGRRTAGHDRGARQGRLRVLEPGRAVKRLVSGVRTGCLFAEA